MPAPKANPTYMVTGKVRASYFFGIVPANDKDDNGNEVIKFRTQILIPMSDKDTLEKIHACCKAVTRDPKALAKWGGSVPGKLTLPLRNGNTEEDDDGKPLNPEVYKDMFFMNINSGNSQDGTPQKPGVIGPNGEPPYLMDDNGMPQKDRQYGGSKYDPQFIVSGDYIRVSLRFYAYAVKGKKGISCALNNIQLLKKGEPLGGRKSAQDDFADGFVDDSEPADQAEGFDADDPLSGLLG